MSSNPSAFRPLPSQSRLRELLNYNPETGSLVWRISTNNQVKPGDDFGCNDRGVRRIGNIDGALYLAHRLIWRFMTGDDPRCEIDHENTDGSDNRWSNLRLATSV